MGNPATVPMFDKDGSLLDVRAEDVPAALKDGAEMGHKVIYNGEHLTVRTSDLGPALRDGAVPAGISMPNIKMNTSAAPGVFRGATGTLPVVGGTAGALYGSGAGGIGALLGGALGAAGGESARLAVNRSVLGSDEPSPISKEGLKSTAVAGAIGGAAELPGAVMSTAGILINKVALAQGEKQVGDAVAGIMSASPTAASKMMMLRDVTTAARQDASSLRSVLAQNNNTINVDSVLAGARNEARQAMTNQPVLRAVPKQLEITIAAAKQRAGIVGNDATPQQLFDFMRELRAFKGDPGKASGVVQDLAKMAYRDSGQALRATVPQSDTLLSRLTNYHAAADAIKNYSPGNVASLAITAATHPRATALASPLISAAIPTAIDEGKKVVGNLASEFTK